MSGTGSGGGKRGADERASSFGHSYTRAIQVFSQSTVELVQPAQFQVRHALLLIFPITSRADFICWRHSFGVAGEVYGRWVPQSCRGQLRTDRGYAMLHQFSWSATVANSLRGGYLPRGLVSLDGRRRFAWKCLD